MHWSCPSWWPEDDGAETIIHCDELNRAQQEDTLQAIFQFVEPPAEGQQRALHTHKLGLRHKVVVTINPPDGTYQVATLDRALIDRMVMLYVESDYQCWARYATARELDGSVRGFLAGNPAFLARQGSALDMDVEPTERGWEMVSTLRRRCRLPRELEMEVYAGIIGKEAAVSFLRWCVDQAGRPVPATEVLDNWPAVLMPSASSGRCPGGDHERALGPAPGITLPDAPPGRKSGCLPGVPPSRHALCYHKISAQDPPRALAISQDKYDTVVLDAIRAMSAEA